MPCDMDEIDGGVEVDEVPPTGVDAVELVEAGQGGGDANNRRAKRRLCGAGKLSKRFRQIPLDIGMVPGRVLKLPHQCPVERLSGRLVGGPGQRCRPGRLRSPAPIEDIFEAGRKIVG